MKEAYVRNAVLDHNQSFETSSERIPLELFRVKTGIFDDVRVQHPRAGRLEPLPLPPWCFEPDIYLDRGLREPEEAWAEAHPRIRTEIVAVELIESPFQIRKRHGARRPDGESVKLIELRFVRHIGRFVAEDFPRIDHPYLGRARLRHLFEFAHRDRCRVRPEHLARLVLDPERVLHVARRMVLRNVQRGEVMPVILELGAVCDAEAHAAEDVGYLSDGDGNGVQAARLVHVSKYSSKRGKCATITPL